MIECTSEFQSHDPDESTSTIDRLVTENENLHRKLQTLPVIEQAKGILMGRYGIPADDAFEMLRRWSQDTNTKLHLVAQTIISHRCRAEDLETPSRQDPASTPPAHPPGHEASGPDDRSSVAPQPPGFLDENRSSLFPGTPADQSVRSRPLDRRSNYAEQARSHQVHSPPHT